MTRLAAAWQAGGLEQSVALRVGVHQADVTVGNFGSEDLVEFTAIGRGVNLAARLESAAPTGGVLASFEVFALARETLAFGEPVALRLKGIDGEVPAYPLALDVPPQASIPDRPADAGRQRADASPATAPARP